MTDSAVLDTILGLFSSSMRLRCCAVGWLVEARSRRWNLGLAAEDSRPADLSGSGRARGAVLVSLPGPDRIAAQYRAPTGTWLLARALELGLGTSERVM